MTFALQGHVYPLAICALCAGLWLLLKNTQFPYTLLQCLLKTKTLKNVLFLHDVELNLLISFTFALEHLICIYDIVISFHLYYGRKSTPKKSFTNNNISLFSCFKVHLDSSIRKKCIDRGCLCVGEKR